MEKSHSVSLDTIVPMVADSRMSQTDLILTTYVYSVGCGQTGRMGYGFHQLLRHLSFPFIFGYQPSLVHYGGTLLR
eukprot:1381953-Amphidinium_carterae.1